MSVEIKASSSSVGGFVGAVKEGHLVEEEMADGDGVCSVVFNLVAGRDGLAGAVGEAVEPGVLVEFVPLLFDAFCVLFALKHNVGVALAKRSRGGLRRIMHQPLHQKHKRAQKGPLSGMVRRVEGGGNTSVTILL